MATQELPLALLRRPAQAKKTARALYTLPLNQADIAALGHRSDYIQDILAHDAQSPRWTGFDHRDRVADVTVPVSSIGGWYDIFLPGQLRDFQVLQQTGRSARLTIGPWTHAEFNNAVIDEALEFGLPHARGEKPPHRAPVRLYMMGQDTWRDFESWPPSGYSARPLYLAAHGALLAEQPEESAPDQYRYDPANPTSAVGGVRMVKDCGRADNSALEARPDVLTYTTPTPSTRTSKSSAR